MSKAKVSRDYKNSCSVGKELFQNIWFKTLRQNYKVNLLISLGWFELFFAENDCIVTEMFGSVRSNGQFTETCSKKIAHTDLHLNL